ncbi:unnamed protein product [Rotaria magnacalcarata]|nr:unnamed protein product [Rotaria magnacalcarata]
MSVHPSARYTVWSVLIGGSLYSTSVCACLQTQAQRFMCVKTTRAAQKVAWVNYMLIVAMLFLCAGVGFVLFAKYSHCDPLLAKLISKPDQLYPLFVIQTFSRLPGLTGLFIASILSASLSTISSGINSMATAILEDIYKRILKQSTVTDERQAIMSKVLSLAIGILVTILAFAMSYLGNNIIVIVFQIAGSFVTPILGVYILGFFAPRVNSRSILIALSFCLLFQSWVMIGATLTAKQHFERDGRLAVFADECLHSFNSSSNDPKSIDSSLLASWKDLFGCCYKKKTVGSVVMNGDHLSPEHQQVEEERILQN